MKKASSLIILICICVLTLTACGCRHESWIPADCVTAKTCIDCGKTEGEPLGHSWVEASLEAPKTCSACALTEGDRLSQETLFSTETAAPLLGKWACQTSIPGQQLGSGLEAYVDALPCITYVEFMGNGEMLMYTVPQDEAQVADIIYAYTIDTIYEQYAALDMTAQEAEEDILNTHGISLAEYVQNAVDQMDMSTIFMDYTVTYVYYVDGNQLYLGFDWFTQMTPGEYILEDDTLFLPFQGDDPTTFTRVTE